MSITGYAGGAAAVLVSAAGVAATAVLLRRVLLPRWTGPMAALATAVVAYAVLLVPAELLGVVGLFSRGPLVAAYAALGVIAVLVLRNRAQRLPRQVADGGDLISVAAAVVAVGAVAAQWATDVRDTLRNGVTFVDSLHYHLSWAAFIAQSHHTAVIHHFSAGDATAYYPLNDELLHSIAMSLLGRDTLSVFAASIALGLTFFAAHCFGSLYRAGPAAIVAVAPFAALLGPRFAGSAGNDWSAVWPFLAALALLVHTRRLAAADERLSPVPVGLVGLAAGLALGAKLNYVVPVAALVVCAVVLLRRLGVGRVIAALAAGVLLGGGFWYLRDVAAVGSPLPETKLPLFPRPSMPGLDAISHSVLHYASNGHVVRHVFFPEVREFFGPAWWLLLLLVAIGLVWGLFAPGRPGVRAVAVIGWVSLIGYLATPTGAAGPEGQPVVFLQNLRYAWPALLTGAVLVSARAARRRRLLLATEAASLAVLVASLARHDAWAVGGVRRGFLVTIAAIVVTGVVVLVAPRGSAHLRLVGPLALLVVVVVGGVVQNYYLDHRYTSKGTTRTALYGVLRDVHGARIGVVGFPMQYPFYGPGLENHVNYVGEPGPDHSFENYASCDAWRRALAAGHYNYVAVFRFRGRPVPAAYQWLVSDPAATPVAGNSDGAIFRLTGAAPVPCPSVSGTPST